MFYSICTRETGTKKDKLMNTDIDTNDYINEYCPERDQWGAEEIIKYALSVPRDQHRVRVRYDEWKEDGWVEGLLSGGVRVLWDDNGWSTQAISGLEILFVRVVEMETEQA